VTITGRGAERNLWEPERSRRRPVRPVHERHGFRPDRAAMWALVLGVLLMLVAATSSHGAVLSRTAATARPVRTVPIVARHTPVAPVFAGLRATR
jgi:hypothetical protein